LTVGVVVTVVGTSVSVGGADAGEILVMSSAGSVTLTVSTVVPAAPDVGEIPVTATGGLGVTVNALSR
jgi:hypothetical protein